MTIEYGRKSNLVERFFIHFYPFHRREERNERKICEWKQAIISMQEEDCCNFSKKRVMQEKRNRCEKRMREKRSKRKGGEERGIWTAAWYNNNDRASCDQQKNSDWRRRGRRTYEDPPGFVQSSNKGRLDMRKRVHDRKYSFKRDTFTDLLHVTIRGRRQEWIMYHCMLKNRTCIDSRPSHVLEEARIYARADHTWSVTLLRLFFSMSEYSG